MTKAVFCEVIVTLTFDHQILISPSLWLRNSLNHLDKEKKMPELLLAEDMQFEELE